MSLITNSTNSGTNTAVEDSAEIFDAAEAMDRACDDLELLAELVGIFEENRDRLLEELAKAVESGDAKTIGEVGHALKGSISTFSTKRPYLIAREIELSGKDARLETAPQLLDALKTSLSDLSKAVREFLASHQ